MTKDELLRVILLDIEKSGIVMVETTLDKRAYINPQLGIGVWDRNKSSPYILAHEYIHAKYKDCIRRCEHDILSPEEKRANREAILYLWSIFIQNSGDAEHFYLFIAMTECPFEYSEKLIKPLLNLNTFEGDLRKCAIDYISYFDVIDFEHINIYHFIELYGLTHHNYDEIVSIFSEWY